jgi:hypothetical protein
MDSASEPADQEPRVRSAATLGTLDHRRDQHDDCHYNQHTQP